MRYYKISPGRSRNSVGSIRRLSRFLVRVMRNFLRNQGLLLSGAVAYYTLLSVVPFSILALVVLAHVIDEQQLIATLSGYLEMLIPGYAVTLTEQVRAFVEHRKVIGVIGFLTMLFFSSLAFSMLEKAMSVIFFQKVRIERRNFFVSAIIPYAYMLAMGAGIVLVSIIAGAIETLDLDRLELFGWSPKLDTAAAVAFYLLGIVGEMLMLTSLYLVMPVAKIRFRHALIGGITATVLWEITRRVLIWYYAAVSMVNVIYGSIAITVVALLSIEVVAVILLVGAQVIAELERKPDESAGEEESGF